MSRQNRPLGIPKWNEKRKEWRLGVRDRGCRTTVTSKKESERAGKAECYRKAYAWIDAYDAPENKRFIDAWEEFIDWYTLKNKITSAKQIERRGKAHLVPAFKGHKVAKITKREWQAVIDNAFANGAKSIVTLKGIATTITTFCKWCASRGYLRDIDVPLYFSYPIAATTKPKKILQPDQMRLLFSEEVEDENFYIFCFRFLAVTGLRRGELCALQNTRDFDGEYITINESISHDFDITDGKTNAAERRMMLTDIALEQIERHQRRAGKGRYLFCNEEGRMISPRVLGNHWRKWRALHDIDVTLHELRHTFISYSRLKTTLDLESLKQIYGHSENMDTDKVYVHGIIKTPEEIAEEEKKAREIASQLNTVFEIVSSRK